MSFLDLLKRNKAPIVEAVEEEKEEASIDNSVIGLAKKTREIIEQYIYDGRYDLIKEAVNSYLYPDSSREYYAFVGLGTDHWTKMIIYGVLFALGYVYFAIMSFATLVYSPKYGILGEYGVLISAAVMLINVFFITKAVKEIRYYSRYSRYQNILRYKNIVMINDLSSLTGYKTNLVVSDLKKAIKRNLIPQGHFIRYNTVFMVSDSVYNYYLTHVAACDRYFEGIISRKTNASAKTEPSNINAENGLIIMGDIRKDAVKISDNKLTERIDRMEKIVLAISHQMDIDQDNYDMLGQFIEYYLGTMKRLLDSYLTRMKAYKSNKNLIPSSILISEAADSVNNAYDELLMRFFKEQEVKMLSDVAEIEG